MILKNPFFYLILTIAFLFYQLNFTAYHFPSSSMSPTLMEGDRMYMKKRIYKKSKPARGDLIVFYLPSDPSRPFVKRIVGLPGESIEIKDGKILVNGEAINKPKPLVSLTYLNNGDYGKAGQTIQIPNSNYFVLGDNSATSLDSRYWGFVPRRNILGKIVFIYFPLNRLGPVQ